MIKIQKAMINVFVSSINQNAGKTTVSLGLIKALTDQGLKTTFMKPVGQKVVPVQGMNIDKDSYLIGQIYHSARSYRLMSPVTIGRGFTEEYISSPNPEALRKKIQDAYRSLCRAKDAIVVEGTGHAGVGAVIDLSNADVAKLLGSKTIIISGGGIGRAIDEIMLNKALFDMCGVEVIGVIVNKVLPAKYTKVKAALKKGLNQKGIKLLGVIPQQPLLSEPTVEQICQHLGLEILCGHKSINTRVLGVIVAAMEPHNMIHHLEDGTLVLTSGDRVDNILAAVSSHLVQKGRNVQIAGIIMTGGLKPSPKIIDLLEKSRIPILITNKDTFTVATELENLICKIQKSDQDKIQEARRLFSKYVNLDIIIQSFIEK